MNTEFSLTDFIRDLWGSAFSGHLKLWNRQTKTTDSYGPDDIARLVDDLDKRKRNEDLYLGLATQPADLGPGERGSSETAILLPGLFADIDFAEAKANGKPYPPDRSTALDLIHQFEDQPSFIQDSGNGLHVLYFFDEPLEIRNLQDWRRADAILRNFGKKLAAHFARAGYQIDSVSDLARVFRVPGTYNHKSDEPKPVTVIAYDPGKRLALDELPDTPPTEADETAKQAPRQDADHSTIQVECPWYRHHTGEGAASSDEPNWYAAASITARCKDGEAIFHDYSSHYPDYSRREAERKFRRALEEAGPRTCEAIRSELGNERFCDSCPHQGTITSPIQLGKVYDPGQTGPRPLGYTREGNYALLDPVRNIVIMASAQQLLAQQYLLGLADSGFWRRQFPGKKAANYMAAGEALIKACLRAGPFDPRRIRGRGVWLEDGEVIVNLGQPLESAKFLYLCFDSILLDDSIGFDAQRLRNHFDLYNWRNPLDAGLLFGWLALAPICGALSWRPHCFVYGPARSGKTTIHMVASIVLSPLAISADGQSTEAGIRQTLGPDSLPILLDEFESDQRSSTLNNVLRLARSASSAETPVLKGTPEGKAMTFSLRTAFFFSAINPRGMSAADQSRISMFELLMHDNDRDTAKRIAEDEVHFRTTGSGWCSHMIGLAHLVQPAADAIDVHLTGDRRHRQNMSLLLGASFVALNARCPTDEEARTLAVEYAPAIEQHCLEADRDDAQECLDRLLSFKVEDYPLGHWLASARDKQAGRKNDFADAERIVASYGMRVITKGEDAGVYIANGSPPLEEVFRNSTWDGRAWQRSLRKLEGAFIPPNPIQFKLLGKKRATGLPLSCLPDEPLPLGSGKF